MVDANSLRAERICTSRPAALSDTDIKTDLIRMVEHFAAMRQAANERAELRIAWRPLPIQVTKVTSNQLKIRLPMRDLIPIGTFRF